MNESCILVTDANLFTHAVGTRALNLAKSISSNSSVQRELFAVGMNDKFAFDYNVKDEVGCYLIPFINIKYLNKFFFILFTFLLLVSISFSKKESTIIAVGPYSIFISLLSKPLIANPIIIYDVPGISKLERNIRYSSSNDLHSYLVNKAHNAGLKKSNFISTINYMHKFLLAKSTNKRIVISRDGADRDKYYLSTEKNLIRNELQINNENIVILFVGSLSLDKLSDLIISSERLYKEFPLLKFIVVGSGNKTNFSKKLVNDSGLEDFFQFTGFISEERLIKYMNSADIAFSDYWSLVGFPRKIFEYMASGLPIIVKDANPIREVLKNNRESILYSSPDELYNGLKKLISDKEYRRELGKNSRKASRIYTWTNSSTEILDIIDNRLVQD